MRKIAGLGIGILFEISLGWQILKAAPADTLNHGYIVRHGRFWQFEDGTPYIPIGVSLGDISFLSSSASFTQQWGMTPSDFFSKLANNGVNFLALHANRTDWFSYPEWYEFDSLHATQNLNWLMNTLVTNGQYGVLGITHHNEFIEDRQWTWNAYNSLQMGTCITPDNFVADSLSIEKMKQKIRFYSKWCGYRSFGWWQLSTEWVNAADSLTSNFKNINTINWHRTLADYIKSLSIANHSVSGNLHYMDYHTDVPTEMWWDWKEIDRSWGWLYDSLFSIPSIDYVNIHTYFEDVGFAISDFWKYNKPILITESVSDLFSENGRPTWIKDGIEFLRFQTWASVALWTVAPDWSIWTVDPKGNPLPVDVDMFEHFDDYCAVFNAASNFSKNVLIPNQHYWSEWPEIISYQISGSGRIYGTADADHIMALIFNSSGNYNIEGLTFEKYCVEWYNTLTGELIEKITQTGSSFTVEGPGGLVMLYIRPEAEAFVATENVFIKPQQFIRIANKGSDGQTTHVQLHCKMNRRGFLSANLFRIDGKCVAYQNNIPYVEGEQFISIDMPNIGTGVYILQIITDDRNYFLKIQQVGHSL